MQDESYDDDDDPDTMHEPFFSFTIYFTYSGKENPFISLFVVSFFVL